MNNKPRYRYNHDKGEWEELIRFTTDVHFISPFKRPDGSLNSFTLPADSPLTDFYRKHGVCGIG